MLSKALSFVSVAVIGSMFLLGTGMLIFLYTTRTYEAFVQTRKWIGPNCPDAAALDSVQWNNVIIKLTFAVLIILVAYIAYLMSSSAWLKPALRLFTVSIILLFSVNILFAFAEAYSVLGLKGDGAGAGDYVYFSAITFATVGYGDFVPCPKARNFAALEGLVGITLFPIMLGLFLSRDGTDT